MPNACEEGAIENLELVSAITSLVISGTPDISRLCLAKSLFHLESLFGKPGMALSSFIGCQYSFKQVKFDNPR